MNQILIYHISTRTNHITFWNVLTGSILIVSLESNILWYILYIRNISTIISHYKSWLPTSHNLSISYINLNNLIKLGKRGKEHKQVSGTSVERNERFRARRGLSKVSFRLRCYPGRYFFLWSTGKCQGSAGTPIPPCVMTCFTRVL